MKRLNRILLSGLAALSVAACDVAAPARVAAPADTAAGEIAFRLEGPNEAVLMVPVYINGEGPLNFVLDTGATLTCVAQELADRLELPQQRGVRGFGAGIGSAGAVRLVGIDSLRVGEAQAFSLPACVLDLQHIGAIGVEIVGLLGLNFLKSFRLTLDFERNVLLLVEP
ncbi:hypothetical protein BH23GEM7_BH23GEM7_22300 [soil metagenome]